MDFRFRPVLRGRSSRLSIAHSTRRCRTRESRSGWRNRGVRVVGGPPERLGQQISSEYARWAKVVKENNTTCKNDAPLSVRRETATALRPRDDTASLPEAPVSNRNCTRDHETRVVILEVHSTHIQKPFEATTRFSMDPASPRAGARSRMTTFHGKEHCDEAPTAPLPTAPLPTAPLPVSKPWHTPGDGYGPAASA